jgi:hypothetical protein
MVPLLQSEDRLHWCKAYTMLQIHRWMCQDHVHFVPPGYTPLRDLRYSQASQYMLRVMAGGRTNYIFPMHHSSKFEFARITEKIETIVSMTYQGMAASRALLAKHAIKLPRLIHEIKSTTKCRVWAECLSNRSVIEEDVIELAMWGSDEEVRRGKKAFNELIVCLMAYDLPHSPY